MTKTICQNRKVVAFIYREYQLRQGNIRQARVRIIPSDLSRTELYLALWYKTQRPVYFVQGRLGSVYL